MKKLFIILLTLTAVASMTLFTGCGGDSDTIHVGILQVATHTALDSARVGFEKELEDWAKQNGKKVVFDRQNANNDGNNENTLARSIVNKKPDLVLGVSTSSARALANCTEEIPVLFTAVTAPDKEGLERANVTGTSDLNPVAEQIALIREFCPECKKIGFLYNSAESNSVVQYDLAKAKCDEMSEKSSLELVKMTVSQQSDIHTVVEGIADDIDAVYVPTDNLIASNIATVCSILHGEKHIPVVAGEEGMCEDNEAVATLGVDYEKLGKQTADMAVLILDGSKKIGEIKFEYYKEAPAFFINEHNAKTAGLSDEIINEVRKSQRKKAE